LIYYPNENENIEIQIYPSEAINAGIATAIRPTAAVAVSSDVLTPFLIFIL
jgi:preprotein translocase subunit Sec61beta